MDVREEFVATLLHPDEYRRNFNRVASLSSENVTFLNRKFFSKAGWELVKYPMSECRSVSYKDERPLLGMFFGALLVALAIFIFYALVVYWDRLDAGTRIPAGLVGLAGLYGIRMLFGARRHRLVFFLAGERKLTWQSQSGDHKHKQASVDKVVAFARSKGLLKAHH
jgi:hypothetical protein